MPVILSEAKNLTRHTEILRFAQNDSQGGLINLDRLAGAGLAPAQVIYYKHGN